MKSITEVSKIQFHSNQSKSCRDISLKTTNVNLMVGLVWARYFTVRQCLNLPDRTDTVLLNCTAPGPTPSANNKFHRVNKKKENVKPDRRIKTIVCKKRRRKNPTRIDQYLNYNSNHLITT